MMQRIHLIRHGATVANLQNLYCGKSDLPLAPEGEADTIIPKESKALKRLLWGCFGL